MPTRNRRRFAAQAICYFQRRDHLHRELVVLDDGEESVEDLARGDDRIRYLRVGPLSIGAKRNLACESSLGEIIAHWDDDDWMGPSRLSAQLQQLLSGDYAACGLNSLLHYSLRTGQAYLYEPASSDRPWLAGCTLMYHRRTWREYPFAELNVGEDGRFVGGLAPDRLRPLADRSIYMAVIHDSNCPSKIFRFICDH